MSCRNQLNDKMKAPIWNQPQSIIVARKVWLVGWLGFMAYQPL